MGVSNTDCFHCGKLCIGKSGTIKKSMGPDVGEVLICRKCYRTGGPVAPSRKANNAPKFVARLVDKNSLCPCGSGLKFRKCCMNTGRIRRPVAQGTMVKSKYRPLTEKELALLSEPELNAALRQRENEEAAKARIEAALAAMTPEQIAELSGTVLATNDGKLIGVQDASHNQNPTG